MNIHSFNKGATYTDFSQEKISYIASEQNNIRSLYDKANSIVTPLISKTSAVASFALCTFVACIAVVGIVTYSPTIKVIVLSASLLSLIVNPLKTIKVASLIIAIQFPIICTSSGLTYLYTRTNLNNLFNYCADIHSKSISNKINSRYSFNGSNNQILLKDDDLKKIIKNDPRIAINLINKFNLDQIFTLKSLISHEKFNLLMENCVTPEALLIKEIGQLQKNDLQMAIAILNKYTTLFNDPTTAFVIRRLIGDKFSDKGNALFIETFVNQNISPKVKIQFGGKKEVSINLETIKNHSETFKEMFENQFKIEDDPLEIPFRGISQEAIDTFAALINGEKSLIELNKKIEGKTLQDQLVNLADFFGMDNLCMTLTGSKDY